MKRWKIPLSTIIVVFLITLNIQASDDHDHKQIPLSSAQVTPTSNTSIQTTSLPNHYHEPDDEYKTFFCCTTATCALVGCLVATAAGCSLTPRLPKYHTYQQHTDHVDQNFANTARMSLYIIPTFTLIPSLGVIGYYGYQYYKYYKNKV
jgi:hypothetical protein